MTDERTGKAKETDPWKDLTDRQRKIRQRRFVSDPEDFIVIRFDDEARQEVEGALRERR